MKFLLGWIPQSNPSPWNHPTKTGQPADRPVAPEVAEPLPLTDSVNVEVESYLKHTYTPDFGQVGLLLDFEPRSQPKLFQFVVR